MIFRSFRGFDPLGAFGAVSGDTMNVNDHLDLSDQVVSADGRFQFVLQSDGNLVVYVVATHKVLWTSNTQGKGGKYLVVQPDGNLVLYKSPGWGPVWSTGTNGKGGARLVLQNDGNLVLTTTAWKLVWATNKTDNTAPVPAAPASVPPSGIVSSVPPPGAAWRPTTALPSPANVQIAYVLRRWVGHKLGEVPEADRRRIADYMKKAWNDAAQFPRLAPLSPVWLVVFSGGGSICCPPGSNGTIGVKRDDGERAREINDNYKWFFDPARQDQTLAVGRGLYQRDWGVLGIEGFHAKDALMAVGKIAVSVGAVVAVIPGGQLIGGIVAGAGALTSVGASLVPTGAQVQSGTGHQGTIVSDVSNFMAMRIEDLLYTPGGVPIDTATGQVVHPDQIATPDSAVPWGIIAAGGGAVLLAYAIGRK